MHVWQSKRVLKTGPIYQVPTWVKNRPKAIATADWEQMVKDFKFNKLIVLDKVPKTSKKKNFATNERKENNNNDKNNR